jgi:hypothetical protein
MQNWNDKVLTVDDFNSDDSVVYVPKHKQSNPTLEDCEPGRIRSKNDTYVFVQFWNQAAERYEETAKACYPNDLRHKL